MTIEISLILLIGGCSGTLNKKPQMPKGSVTETSPYWCNFIPKTAFRVVTGLNDIVREDQEGWLAYQGLCLAYDRGQNPVLGVSWAIDGRAIESQQAKAYAADGPTMLPRSLGSAFTVDKANAATGRPYYTIAAFRCGAISPWIRIDFSQAAPGRNYIDDVTALMQIAERRFGSYHNCTPGPLN